MKLDLVSLVAMFGAVYTAPPDSAGSGAAPAGGGASPAPGAADGGADAGDLGDGADDAGDALGAAADEQNAGDADDLDALLDDDEEDDQQTQTRTAEDRLKALNAKNRKLRRRLLRSKGTLERLKGVDLDDLVTRARQFDDLQRSAATNPRLRALLNGGDDDDADGRGTPARRGSRQNDDPDFDEASLPFDPNANDANRYFANLARQNHDMQRTLRQLSRKFEGFTQQDSQRSEATQRREWGTVVKDAAAQITQPGVRKVFQDAVVGAFNNPGIRAKYTPQQIVAHYLKELGVQPRQAARANSAARQRVAENNRTLPRHPAQGGSPAPARNPKERLADVHRRIRQVG